MKKLYRISGLLNPNEPRGFLYICILVLFLGGLISVWLGADANWDLANYHLYNPFAFFHQKLAIDLAPAGMQTYFNPLLDIPYYWMSSHLPGVLVGFIMGFIHAGNFILVTLIARQLLPELPSRDQFRWPLLLALFGCATANFSSAFGNTMGDITTALLVLFGLFIIVRNLSSGQRDQRKLAVACLLAGFSVGLATGLKLTNAVFAVALCISFLFLPFSLFVRFKLATLFGVVVLLGIAVTGGYWFYKMWAQFNNPLYPQFSAFFPNELTNSIAVADGRWGPKNFFEIIFWPIIISIHPFRVGELKHHQIIWAVFYIVLLIWIARTILPFRKSDFKISITPSAKYFIAFVAIAFIVWMKAFSIQRYLAAVEILVPLVLFLMLSHIFYYEIARKYAKYLLISATAFVYIGGAKSWGHEGWAWDMFRIELPPIQVPEKATVIMAGGNPPFGWLAAQFPASISFVQIDGSFPANIPAYSQRINQIVNSRDGEIFVLFQSAPDSERAKRVVKANEVFSYLGTTQSAKGCAFLKKIIPSLKLQQKVQLDFDSDNNCHLTAINFNVPSDQTDAFYQDQASQQLIKYGYDLNTPSCQTYQAFIGQKVYKYRWCSVAIRP